ncbi:hypothetical protein, partial [Sulfobacillus thermosulfidooxidans]|uniref:hypothetical protein n=1 Tax=Sulfobacillus thermosulfidooxidans TaxID=28034 RepID=UPI0003738150
PFDPHEIRLSATGGCPRQQTLRILDYEAEPPSVQQLSIFHAGHYWEDYLASLWEARYPGQVNRQVTVETAWGTGHIDLWIEPIHHLVECKTSTSKRRDDLPLEEHLDQVNLYLHFWGNDHQATAEIAYVLKDTGEVLTFPVTYDPDRIPVLLDRLQRMIIAVTIDEEPLPIPDDYAPARFPCAWRTPTGGWRRCEFWRACWTHSPSSKPTPDTTADPSWDETLRAHYALSAEIAQLKAQLKALEDEKKTYEKALGAYLDDTQQPHLTTPWGILTRTVSQPTVSYDVKAALKDGQITLDQIAPYRKLAQPRVSWAWKDPERLHSAS